MLPAPPWGHGTLVGVSIAYPEVRTMPPHHHRHHGPEWIVAVHDDELSRTEYAAVLAAVADAVRTDGQVDVNGTVIDVPEVVEFDLRYERTPHGALALVVKVEWHEKVTTCEAASARSLSIRPAHDAGPTA